MGRVFSSIACACVGMCLATQAEATSFELSFEAPNQIEVGLGRQWTHDVGCAIASSGGGTGAQGWSMSLTADEAQITSITTAGTIVEQLFAGGFLKSELTTRGDQECAGRLGATSACILSLTEVRTLEPDRINPVARVKIEGSFDMGAPLPTLRYVNGCQQSGQPIQNNIVQDGETRIPVRRDRTFGFVIVDPCCLGILNWGFSTLPISSDKAYDRIVDDGSGTCNGGGGTVVSSNFPGRVGEVEVFLNLSSDGASGGIQGWSLSMPLDGEVEFGAVGATTAGTSVDKYFDGGFQKTEVVRPDRNGGQRGAVSAVVLAFVTVSVLPPTGTESILRIPLKSPFPITASRSASGSLALVDGLRGSGGPVSNNLTVDGATNLACNTRTTNVSIQFSAFAVDPPFVRGNANGDARVNLADPIWILNELFRHGPKTACLAWADANGDALIDLADSVYLIGYLLLGSAPPPEPFPACGLGAGIGSSCETLQESCG